MRRLCPPESLPTERRRRSSKFSSCASSDRRLLNAAPLIPYSAARLSRLSLTDSSLSKTELWNTTPRLRLTLSGSRSMSVPHISTLPPSRASWPQMMFMVVDFPAPFTPKNANSSPFLTLKLRSLTAITSPKCFCRCSIFIRSVILFLSLHFQHRNFSTTALFFQAKRTRWLQLGARAFMHIVKIDN